MAPVRRPAQAQQARWAGNSLGWPRLIISLLLSKNPILIFDNNRLRRTHACTYPIRQAARKRCQKERKLNMQAPGAKADFFHPEAGPTARSKNLPVEEALALRGSCGEDLGGSSVKALLSRPGKDGFLDPGGICSRHQDAAARAAGGPGSRCGARGTIQAQRAGGAEGRCARPR